MEKVKFTNFPSNENWTNGTHAGGYRFEAKLFDEGSIYGINKGRVSKLAIRDAAGRWIVNYERGWDIRPETEEHERVFQEILEFLENAPKRFS